MNLDRQCPLRWDQACHLCRGHARGGSFCRVVVRWEVQTEQNERWVARVLGGGRRGSEVDLQLPGGVSELGTCLAQVKMQDLVDKE